MGKKMERARKLEPADDASASGAGPRKGLDISIADPTDCPILDDQAVSDILETGTFRVPDQSTGDSRDEKEKVDPSRTDVIDHDTPTNETDSADNYAGDDDAARTIERRLETIRMKAMLEEVTEITTARRRYRLSWTLRVLNLFRRY